MRRVISVLVENRFGAFDRIFTMFSGKGFNLHSVSVGKTELEGISRMTLVTSGDEKIFDQVIKQLNRIIDTVKVIDLTEQPRTERELALISINFSKGSRTEIKAFGDMFKCKVVDITHKSITYEITGPPDKIDAAINILAQFGIIEVARTGTVSLKRGEQKMQIKKLDVLNNHFKIIKD